MGKNRGKNRKSATKAAARNNGNAYGSGIVTWAELDRKHPKIDPKNSYGNSDTAPYLIFRQETI